MAHTKYEHDWIGRLNWDPGRCGCRFFAAWHSLGVPITESLDAAVQIQHSICIRRFIPDSNSTSAWSGEQRKERKEKKNEDVLALLLVVVSSAGFWESVILLHHVRIKIMME